MLAYSLHVVTSSIASRVFERHPINRGIVRRDRRKLRGIISRISGGENENRSNAKHRRKKKKKKTSGIEKRRDGQVTLAWHFLVRSISNLFLSRRGYGWCVQSRVILRWRREFEARNYT